MNEPLRQHEITMTLLCEIPESRHGKTVGICTWHDEIFVATEFGGIYRLVIHPHDHAQTRLAPVIPLDPSGRPYSTHGGLT